MQFQVGARSVLLRKEGSCRVPDGGDETGSLREQARGNDRRAEGRKSDGWRFGIKIHAGDAPLTAEVDWGSNCVWTLCSSGAASIRILTNVRDAFLLQLNATQLQREREEAVPLRPPGGGAYEGT
jgi:hypothetical protein